MKTGGCSANGLPRLLTPHTTQEALCRAAARQKQPHRFLCFELQAPERGQGARRRHLRRRDHRRQRQDARGARRTPKRSASLLVVPGHGSARARPLRLPRALPGGSGRPATPRGVRRGPPRAQPIATGASSEPRPKPPFPPLLAMCAFHASTHSMHSLHPCTHTFHAFFTFHASIGIHSMHSRRGSAATRRQRRWPSSSQSASSEPWLASQPRAATHRSRGPPADPGPASGPEGRALAACMPK